MTTFIGEEYAKSEALSLGYGGPDLPEMIELGGRA